MKNLQGGAVHRGPPTWHTATMAQTYAASAAQFAAVRSQFSGSSLLLLDDHIDGAYTLAARAEFVDAVYAYAYTWRDGAERVACPVSSLHEP